jgi:6-pyruvoyltetrahydropterin/6-carboxytetrahydropterin synthase
MGNGRNTMQNQKTVIGGSDSTVCSVASFSVFKEFRLYCAHSVQSFGEEHKCSRKHGHCYKIRIEVHKHVDPKTFIAIPFDEIEKAWKKVGEPLDHTDLNGKFGPNATTEVLAMYLHGQMGMALGHKCSIEVRETESSGVVVRS